jgi:hypothetical protein
MTSSQLRDERRSFAFAQHRHQRDDSRAAADQEHGAAHLGLPDEVAADRPAQLDPVAGPQHIRQIGRDLAVVEPFHRQLDARAVGSGPDRVAPLGLVPVLGGQSDVDVLAGPVAGPSRDVEGDRLGPRRLRHELDDLRLQPVQSPQ